MLNILRVAGLNLESLETTRLKWDLSIIHKLIHGHLGLNSDKFLNIVKGSSTRGHQYKVYKHSCSVNVYKYNFPSRCIDAWKCLQNSVVDALTTAEFRCKLENVISVNFLPYSIKT
jgi:hypothetical protein